MWDMHNLVYTHIGKHKIEILRTCSLTLAWPNSNSIISDEAGLTDFRPWYHLVYSNVMKRSESPLITLHITITINQIENK